MSDSTSTSEDSPTPQESIDDSGTESPHSRLFRGVVWIQEHLVLLLVGVLVVSFIVAVVVKQVSLPRWSRLAVLGAVAAAPYGHWVGNKVREWLWDPSYRWVVDVKAEAPTYGGIYRWPSQRFREDVTILEGELDWVHGSLAFARDVDLSESTMRGTWRGTLSDRQLLVSLQEVSKCKGQLLHDAKRGFAMRSSASHIVRSATRKAVMRVVNTLENGVLPDRGESIENAVDDAVRDHDFQESVTDLDDVEEGADLPEDSLSIDIDLDGADGDADE